MASIGDRIGAKEIKQLETLLLKDRSNMGLTKSKRVTVEMLTLHLRKNRQSRSNCEKKSRNEMDGNQHSYCFRKLCNAVFNQAKDSSLVTINR